ncbi:HPr family phosphocarrier protein [uncultured Ferrimonas sp.]|uniref:HPr family phosphocarrier protein n=1 Tax=uncultured Ferrimonas sp. TaxID=432640 RepID=UPI00262B1992|nr:HPr family phosphocarrier protein [uncultured Ferrimonas sp.]
MYQRQVVIAAPHGIHTRPAAVLVKQAQQYQADINILCNGQTANGKSLFRLQMLNLCHGCEVTVAADGVDAEQAVNELIALLQTLS